MKADLDVENDTRGRDNFRSVDGAAGSIFSPPAVVKNETGYVDKGWEWGK